MDFDYLVIGAGSGGIASARRAAALGAKVAIVEKTALGGTCVNVGCVPKKVMWNAAEIASSLKIARDYGFDVPGHTHDFGALKARRDAYISRLHGVYTRLLKEVTVLTGRASFVAKDRVRVGDEEFRARHILIATGGEPNCPKVVGAELGMTSDGFFSLSELPPNIVIVGGGYIAVEIAGVLNSLGSKVTLVVRGDRLLKSFDEEISAHLSRHMQEDGVSIRFNAEVNRIERASRGLSVFVTENGTTTQIASDQVLWAIGRNPKTQDLGLERCGVELTAEGFVKVDEFQSTNVAGIYAVGDVTGRVELTPVAIAAGRKLAHRLFGSEANAKISYDNIPSVVFSHPPIGTQGMTESMAKAKYGNTVKVYKSKFTNMFYSLSDRRPETLMKLVTVGPSEKIVGLHVIGLGADEMVQGFAVAIVMGATKSDFDRTMAIHPTAAEEFVTLT